MIGVVVLGATLGGATMSPIFVLVLLTAILVLFDASVAGMQRVPGRKGLLNMDPVGWGGATALLFLLAWPLYLVARVRTGLDKGNRPLLIGVVLCGLLVLGTTGVSLAGAFLSPPVGATVQCNGGPKGLQCKVKQTSGNDAARVCWTVTMDCTTGKPATTEACVDVTPQKPMSHLIPLKEISGLQTCGKVKKMRVNVVSVKAVKR